MHSNQISLILAAAASLASAATHSGTGKTTRYWDCCKPSCSWNDKAKVSSPFATCDAQGNKLTDPDIKSGCDGGEAYTCTDNAPWVISSDLAYGFAATAFTGKSEADWCCACYAVTFTSGPVAGKKMVVQSSNTGGDLGENHFDILMPGGGLGIFDGCTPQFGQSLPGERYGGVTSKDQCAAMPTPLQAGCGWRFEWFQNADNPAITFERVQCPAALTAKSGCKRDDDAEYPVFAGDNGSAAPVESSSSSPAPKPTTSQAPPPAATTLATSSAVNSPAPTTPAPIANEPVETSAKPVPTSTKRPGKSCPAKKRKLRRSH